MSYETNYKLGDTVFYPRFEYTSNFIKCPECLGMKFWRVTKPNGEKIITDCEKCIRGYDVRGAIEVYDYTPTILEGTIVSVDISRTDYSGERQTEYILDVGTGRYCVRDDSIVKTREEADELAKILIERKKKEDEEKIKKPAKVRRVYSYQQKSITKKLREIIKEDRKISARDALKIMIANKDLPTR